MKSIHRFFYIILILFGTAVYATQTVHIGVLAHKNYDSTHTMWDATADYLNREIPEYRFDIVPLRFEEFPAALQKREIDFIIINSAYYVTLEHHYGISRIATLKNDDMYHHGLTAFGGVMFTRKNSPIHSMEDLRAKRFAAVDQDSFGGWIMALRELHENGIDREDMKVSFYGTHEAVVHAVMEGRADAGTVRSDTLERMAAEKKIDMGDISVIAPKNYPDFNYFTSTRLYPEWPIATTKWTPDVLAEKVAVALISMPPDAEAAQHSHSMGWTIPLDYQSIHECLKELQLGPYVHNREDAVGYFLEQYGLYLAVGGGAFLFLSILTLYIGRINRNLRETRAKLEQTNLTLEEKVDEKTHHLLLNSQKLEDAYLKEKYLRSILRTVADINQMLITTRSIDELIDKAVLSLSSNESFKSAKIALIRDKELYLAAAYGVSVFKQVTGFERRVFTEGKSVMLTDFSLDGMEECREHAKVHGITGMYILPLKASQFTTDVLGVLTICTGRSEGFSIEEQRMITELCGDIGFALDAFAKEEHIQSLHEERLKSYESFIEALVNMIEQRDTYTAGHTERVSTYARMIAEEMELPEKEIEKLVAAAKLHDIGKVVTPDSILLKPGSLAPLEYELIKQHVVAGYDVLVTVNLYTELAEIMRDHHERYDGSGYPDGKKGGEIPLMGYILGVADSFDAMTTNRIYKPRKDVDSALRELGELSGTWYHPAVVNAAAKVLKNVEIDTSISQMTGLSALEQERMSYFFKDRLTKLYNEDYFAMLLTGRGRHPKPKWIWIVSFVDFHSYNKSNGWEKGNHLFTRFAEFLMDKFAEYPVFRMWGDRFVIADYEGDIAPILEQSFLRDEGLRLRLKRLEVNSDNIEALMYEAKEP